MGKLPILVSFVTNAFTNDIPQPIVKEPTKMATKSAMAFKNENKSKSRKSLWL